MSADAAAKIAGLRQEIRRHDWKYYVQAQPEISDLEYDRLLERLKRLEAEHPELITADSPTQRVGDQPVAELPQVVHRVPMLSIENTYSLDDLRKFGQRVAKLLAGEPIEWVVELKVDGVAVSLVYEDGRLVQGVTRGNGRVGDDVTHNLRTVHDIPLRLRGAAFPPLLEPRGEVYMTNRDLVLLNERQKREGKPLFANTRNVTAGSIRQLDSRICAERRLRFFCHSVGYCEGLAARTHTEFLAQMQDYGIPVTPGAACLPSFEAAIEHCEQLIERLHELDFEIDGLVLKANRFDQRERLGATSKAPRWVIAYKFEKYEATTRLSAIRVQVGKTGAITPVADLEPVELAGTTVSHASLHNAEEIERKDVRPGDVVVVEKAGKIIPHVVRVEAAERKGEPPKFAFPTKCPECGTRLVKDEGGVYIRCPNAACPAQVKERIRYFAGRNAMDIEGLGDELVDKLVNEKLVQTYADLYRLTVNQLTGLSFDYEWGQPLAEKIVRGIEETRQFGLEWFLQALSNGEIKRRHAISLADRFAPVDLLMGATIEQIAKVGGMGSMIAQGIYECLHDDIGTKTMAALGALGVEVFARSRIGIPIHAGGVERGHADAVDRYGIEEFKSRLQYFVGGVKEGTKKKGVTGLAKQRVDQLVDEGLVRCYADLYRLTVDAMKGLRRVVTITEDEARKQLELIEKSKDRGLARLLNGLSIRHVGNRVATVLAERFGSMESLIAASLDEIADTTDIGPIIAQSVFDFLHGDFGSKAIADLKSLGVKMDAPRVRGNRPLEGKTIVVTGTIGGYTRDEITERITQHGGHAASSVSKKTDYVLAGENPGSKLEKAKELGVPVLSKEQFERLLSR